MPRSSSGSGIWDLPREVRIAELPYEKVKEVRRGMKIMQHQLADILHRRRVDPAALSGPALLREEDTLRALKTVLAEVEYYYFGLSPINESPASA